MDTGSTPKVALFDVCETLVGVTTLPDFSEYFLLSQRNKEFSRTKWATHMLYKFVRQRLKRISSTTYRRHLISMFGGHTVASINEMAPAYNERLQRVLKKPVFEKLEELKRGGYKIYLVTGGLGAYLGPFAESLGATLVATTLEKDSTGRYTGRVEGPDCLGEGKIEKLRKVLSFEDVDWEASWAFGDSVSDIPMLSLVGHAWVVDPTREQLKMRAAEKGWTIINTKAAAPPLVEE